MAILRVGVAGADVAAGAEVAAGADVAGTLVGAVVAGAAQATNSTLSTRPMVVMCQTRFIIKISSSCCGCSLAENAAWRSGGSLQAYLLPLWLKILWFLSAVPTSFLPIQLRQSRPGVTCLALAPKQASSRPGQTAMLRLAPVACSGQ